MPEESIIEKIKLEPVEDGFCDIFIEDEKIIIPELMKYENDGYLDLKNEGCLLNEAAIKIEENSVKLCIKKLPYNKEKVTKPKRYRRKQYKCNTCEELFQKQSLLNYHVFKQHRNNKDALKQVEHKILMCNTCSYKSLQRKNLNRHLKVHIKTETKKSPSDGNSNYFYCFHCSYFTNTKHSLAKHLRLHNSYSRLPHCCKGCGKKFNEKNSLDAHIIKNHRSNKQLIQLVTNTIHKCSSCDYMDVNKNKLIRHRKARHGSKKVK